MAHFDKNLCAILEGIGSGPFYVGREKTNQPFIPGYCSDSVLQALTYAAWLANDGLEAAVYRIELSLPTNTSQDNEVRNYITDHETLARIPKPGYYDPGMGEAIITVPVRPNPVDAIEVARAIGKGGTGGSFNRDIEGSTIVLAAPKLFPGEFCSVVKQLVPHWVEPSDYFDDDPSDAKMIQVLSACGIPYGDNALDDF